MIDAAAEPPEINSTLVHTGAGPGPAAEAALAYTAAAAQDEASAATLMGILAAVQAAWDGDAARAATAQLTPLIAWFEELGANCAASAAQLDSISMTVAGAMALSPIPAEVIENRVTSATLHATNFMGVNFPAIGVNDGHYGDMWVRAASARTSSDTEASAASTSLMPWRPPPMPVNPVGMGMAVGQSWGVLSRGIGSGLGGAAEVAGVDGELTELLGEGAAGDAVGSAGLRPSSGWLLQGATEADSASQAAAPGEMVADAASEAPQSLMGAAESPMSGLGQQLPSLMSSATQPVSQLGSQFGQVGQLGQAPMQMLQPLMSAASGLGQQGMTPPPPGSGFGGLGSTPLSAALSRGVGSAAGGGAMSPASAGLRLPPGAPTPAAAPPGGARSGLRGVAAGGARAAGPGMVGMPPRGESKGTDGSANKYEQAFVVGAVPRAVRPV